MIPFGLTFRRGGQASLLCGLATLRAKYFLFTLAKAQAEPQRNCSPPLVCHGGFLPVCLPEAFAALRLCARITFIYSRKGAEPQRNCGPSKKESPLPPYKGELTLVLPSKI